MSNNQDKPKLPSPWSKVTKSEDEKVQKKIMDDFSENLKVAKEVSAKLDRYLNVVSTSNNNILMKFGKSFMTGIRKGIVDSIVSASENGNKELIKGYSDLFEKMNKRLDTLIKRQEEENTLTKEEIKARREEAKKADEERKRAKAVAEEDAAEAKRAKAEERSERLKKAFGIVTQPVRGAFNLFGSAVSGFGSLVGLGDMAKFFKGGAIQALAMIPWVRVGILLGALVLFFVDFQKFMENPNFERMKKTWEEKIVPALEYLNENVLQPFAKWLNDSLLPSTLTFLADLLDETATFIMNAINDFKNLKPSEAIAAVIKDLGKWLSNVGLDLLKAFDGIFGTKFIESFQKMVADGKDNAWKAIVTAVTNLWNNISDAIGGLVDMVIGVFTLDPKKFNEGVETMMLSLTKGVINLFFDTINVINGMLQDEFGKDWLKKLVQPAVDLYNSVANFVSEKITDAINFFSSIGHWFGSLIDAVVNGWKKLQKNVSDFFTSIGDWTVSTFNSIKNGFIAVKNTIVEVVTYPWKMFQNNLEKWKETIGDWMADPWGMIKKTFGEIKNTLFDFITKPWTTLKSKITDYTGIDLTGTIMDQMMTKFEDVRNSFINSIFETFSNAKDWVIEKAMDLDAWTEKLKNKLLDGFWSLIDKIGDAVGKAFIKIGEFFATLPEKIWNFIQMKIAEMASSVWGGDTAYKAIFGESSQDAIKRMSAPVGPVAPSTSLNGVTGTNNMSAKIGEAISVEDARKTLSNLSQNPFNNVSNNGNTIYNIGGSTNIKNVTPPAANYQRRGVFGQQ